MAIKTKSINIIEVQDWDALVEETYGKPYSFQQQDDCKPRGTKSCSETFTLLNLMETQTKDMLLESEMDSLMEISEKA
jgi:hypothetical protein